MAEAFDPYHTWLGIAPKDQPPNHYRLLGVGDFEAKPDVIEHAADQRMAHLRTFQAGKHSALSQKLLNEVAAAKLCLLKPERKAAYDAKLRTDAKPTRAPAKRTAVPVVMLAGAALGILVLGLALWAFFVGWADRSEFHQLASSPPPRSAPARSEKADVVKRPEVRQPEALPSKTNTQPAEHRGEKTEELSARPPAATREGNPQIAQIPQIKTTPPVSPPPAPSPSPPPAQSPSKLPAPDAKALEDGLKIAREAYQGDYARAETAVARRELAKKILLQAIENKDDPVARFVLLRLARDVAIHAEDTGLAYEAIDRLAEGFEVDPWAMKSEIVLAAAKQARKTAEHKAAAEQALVLMRQALEADSCDVAQDMAKLALAEAGKARAKELVAQARAGQKQAQQAAKGLEQVEAARAILKDNADDPAANLTVGRYECFTKGDWAKGLAHLAKGRDGALKSVAEMELKSSSPNPQSPTPNPLSLGDAWWDLAQQAEAREKDAMLLQAGYWYQQLGEIEQALVRTKVENRLTQIGKLGRAISGPPAKKTLTNSIGMQLVLIPAGEFLMGSTPEDFAWAAEEAKKRNDSGALDRILSEAPRHPVRISRPFYLGMYEVTQGEYEQVMGANPSSFSAKGKDAGKVTGMDTGRHPVEMISWEDAAAFCQKLSALPKERGARRVYRLPTEAEWEYACRAGSTGRWSFENSPLPSRERGGGEGEAALGDHAWFTSNSSGMTHPVGQKKPNAFGLFDMHGNVWEWCMDWFGKDYYRQSLPVDPIGPSSGSSRVLRGGRWTSHPFSCRSASRPTVSSPASRYHVLGFRVVVGR